MRKYLALFIILSLLTCKSYFSTEMMVRPDTRLIAGVTFDSAITEKMIHIFRDSMPNETGVCGEGKLIQDEKTKRKLLLITDFLVAKQDSAIPIGIAYTPKHLKEINGKKYTLGMGCEGIPFVIGYGHDHPITLTSWPCTASDNDALFLAGDLKFLFLLTVCPDGRFETLWQDGRRQYGLWKY